MPSLYTVLGLAVLVLPLVFLDSIHYSSRTVRCIYFLTRLHPAAPYYWLSRKNRDTSEPATSRPNGFIASSLRHMLCAKGEMRGSKHRLFLRMCALHEASQGVCHIEKEKGTRTTTQGDTDYHAAPGMERVCVGSVVVSKLRCVTGRAFRVLPQLHRPLEAVSPDQTPFTWQSIALRSTAF